MSVITVTDSTFQAEVVEPSARMPVVVEFSTREKVARRGSPNASAKMDEVLDSLGQLEKYLAKVRFARVEIELDAELKDVLNPASSAAYSINHGPTMFLSKTITGRVKTLWVCRLRNG